MIRKATESDLDQIMELVHSCVRGMQEEGNDQWSDEYPGRTDFLADIDRGELYVDIQDREVRGVISINGVEPDGYDRVTWSRNGEATVLHRLAVNPRFQGHGVARGLLGYAEDVARSNGTSYIRSDTYSRNLRMNALFAKAGYSRVGSVHFERRTAPFYCYDKRV